MRQAFWTDDVAAAALPARGVRERDLAEATAVHE
jgi:hypothetical protein